MMVIEKKVTALEIMAVVANEMGITIAHMKLKSNAQYIVWARQISALVIKTEFPYLSDDSIAAMLDYVCTKQTFMYARKKAKEMLDSGDAEFTALYQSIIKQLQPCLRRTHL